MSIQQTNVNFQMNASSPLALQRFHVENSSANVVNVVSVTNVDNVDNKQKIQQLQNEVNELKQMIQSIAQNAISNITNISNISNISPFIDNIENKNNVFFGLDNEEVKKVYSNVIQYQHHYSTQSGITVTHTDNDDHIHSDQCIRVLPLRINRLEKNQLKYSPKFLSSLSSLSSVALPNKVDLRGKMAPVRDQGNLGSCTSMALNAVVSHNIPDFIGSGLFLYYNERLEEKNVNSDSGAMLSTGVFTLQKYGICKEESWPYVIQKFREMPSANCYREANNHQALTVCNVPQNMNAMKLELSNGHIFVIGIALFESFMTSHVAMTGFVEMPHENENFLGGHAVTCVGYDDEKGVWIMRNSWGVGWGDHGYFYLPYAYLLNPSLSTDIWTITAMEL